MQIPEINSMMTFTAFTEDFYQFHSLPEGR